MQWPQLSENDPVTAALPSRIEIACTGHICTHSPQPVQSSLSITVLKVSNIFFSHEVHFEWSDYGDFVLFRNSGNNVGDTNLLSNLDETSL
jgi:hypothetical protein